MSEKHGAFRSHHFSACGISANLYVGKVIPEYFVLQSAFPKGLLTLNKHFDNKQLGLAVEQVKKNFAHLMK
jgi:hypothetical protein